MLNKEVTMALNSVVLSGRLVKDPETRTVGSDGITVCQFTIAVDKKGKDAGANFIDCTAWRGTGETIAKFFKKGSLIGLSGRLNQETWEKDGKKNSKIGVVVDDFSFLSSVKEEKTPSEEVGLFEEPAKAEKEEIDLSDIPF
jgi:single-strand DNA-binding protein